MVPFVAPAEDLSSARCLRCKIPVSCTESTPRSCPAVFLDEPQEGLDRSQLHSFKKQVISQGQQAAHNATQDHIRLQIEPFLDSQRQTGRRTWRRGILFERAHQVLHPE
jgi:hypothetical protein